MIGIFGPAIAVARFCSTGTASSFKSPCCWHDHWISLGVWHLPLWMAETGSLTGEHIILIIFHIINGVIFAWLYNRSKASILTAGILHTSGNVILHTATT